MAPSKLLALGVVVALATVAARPADACSSSECGRGYFVPGDGATVPANLPVLYWAPMYNDSVTTAVTLTTGAAPGTPLPFTATQLDNGDYLLRPDGGLVAGTTYVLTDTNPCTRNPTQVGPRATFTVGAAAPLPGPLGSLTAQAEDQQSIELATRGGSCSSAAEVASASITLTIVPEAVAWRHVLHHQTFVDGVAWSPRASILGTIAPGASWRGRGEDLVYTICASDDPSLSGLSAGSHQITMRTEIPGFASGFLIEPTSVTLRCAPQCDGAPCTDDGGCAASHAGAAPWLALAFCAARLRRRRQLT